MTVQTTSLSSPGSVAEVVPVGQEPKRRIGVEDPIRATGSMCPNLYATRRCDGRHSKRYDRGE